MRRLALIFGGMMSPFTSSCLAGCLFSALLALGCTIESSNDSRGDGDSGGPDAAGQDSGTVPGPCNGVPEDGRCVDEHHLSRCVPMEGEGAEPVVVTAECRGAMVCVTSSWGASCEPQGGCTEGATSCDTDSAVRTCVQGSWQVTSCGASRCVSAPGQGASCMQQAAGESHPLRGHARYEYRPVNADKTGYGDLAIADARAVIVVAYDGDEYIGSAYTSGSDGTFEIACTKPPTQDTWLFAFPMAFNDEGTIQFAVAIPTTLEYANLRSHAYWYYSVPTNGQSDVGTFVMRESEGSGAIHIHQKLLYGLQKAEELVPGYKPFNVLALWAPGKRFDCGNGTCYVPKGWGVTVEYDGGEDLYQSGIVLAGTEETPHQWSDSVILHELGHYMMEAYSLSPREAAPHSLSNRLRPGMAWSEGWATFYGQSMLKSPMYFDLQIGTASWFDVSRPKAYVPMPDPSGPMDQDIAELAVTAMLWHLWDPEGSGEEAWDGAAVGSQAVWNAFNHERMRNAQYNRGYGRVDWVDMLDSMRCGGATAEDVHGIVVDHFEFPYDNQPRCP